MSDITVEPKSEVPEKELATIPQEATKPKNYA